MVKQGQEEGPMKVIVTAKIKLLPSNEQMIMLDNTLTIIRSSLNYVSKTAYENNLLSFSRKLQKLTYSTLRSTFGLKSQMACNVCSIVAGSYASMKTKKEHALAVYKKSKLQYSYNRDYSLLKNGLISINTVYKRIKMQFISTSVEQYFDGTWEYGAASLIKKKGKYFFFIAVKKDIDICQGKEITNVVGIDFGINYLATAIDSKDSMLFINGRYMKNIKAKYQRLRKSLQQKKTSSARRRLKKICSRENRWQRDINHKAAKALVSFAGNKSLIVLEDLAGIRKPAEKIKHKNRYYSVSWAFSDLRSKIEYKAKLAKILAIAVDPKYTSQKCPDCGNTEKENRNKKTHTFHCKCCGYQSNDDRIGAINLRQKGIEYLNAVPAPV